MKQHVVVCTGPQQSSSASQPTSTPKCPKPKATGGEKLKTSMDSAIIRTSPSYKRALDEQVTNYFYATNSPFQHADHPEFIKLCDMLRPGYKPPTRKDMAGQLLNSAYSFQYEQAKTQFESSTVTMALDGWSNVNNEPIVCINIINGVGQTALVQTIDTSGHSHTAEYLQQLASSGIKRCESEFNLRVGSFVTDKAGNVTKMRRELQKQYDLDIIRYGCTLHILPLLSQDVKFPEVTGHIVKIIKYFLNHHHPAAWYKQSNGRRLMLPIEVRWNTICQAIMSYLKNRGIIVQICQDNKSQIDKDVYKLMNDAKLTTNAEDYAARMAPIAIALDRTQRDHTTIAVAVEIWHNLALKIADQPNSMQQNLVKRRDMALGTVHYLANMVDHCFRGQRVTEDKKSLAYEYLAQISSEFVPLLVSHCARSDAFPAYIYEASLRKMQPIDMWKSINLENCISFNWSQCKPQWIKLCEQLHSADATTATVERTFSTFGLVQSKLRNRLGNEKAAKLTFLFKHMNQNTDAKKKGLDWVWAEEDEEELDLPEEEEAEAAVGDSDIEIVSEEGDGRLPTTSTGSVPAAPPAKRKAPATQLWSGEDST